ncbi:hypothetical protein SDRG_17145 [Saprolegnia diclina VS20]|uniref:BZIP domain-containing protein n=1 Tax=Saprolegnia diclina (strain VS20) TaxID=1156394 RepID=T0PI05_SAPDV|nr:hypothetical protein SDRG_17145 [Saprolegnia diclina VS20]EQC24969.1 hypothetical protein SDRG_17145 [Saprolegnia diclina VS20]|eukprot:XP_008621602.1 hypothetical protein SDRG_17145 [Saprolegnia diclina VS20]
MSHHVSSPKLLLGDDDDAAMVVYWMAALFDDGDEASAKAKRQEALTRRQAAIRRRNERRGLVTTSALSASPQPEGKRKSNRESAQRFRAKTKRAIDKYQRDLATLQEMYPFYVPTPYTPLPKPVCDALPGESKDDLQRRRNAVAAAHSRQKEAHYLEYLKNEVHLCSPSSLCP